MAFNLSSHYHIYSRDKWKNFQSDNLTIPSVEELTHMISVHDRLTVEDIREVYGPLLHYIESDYAYTNQYYQARQKFFHADNESEGAFPHVPFIIGISGSVAVGKSTTARLIYQQLQEIFSERKVTLLTTDGFLYPTEVLEQKGLLNRKGFPESYNMGLLLEFMTHVKTKRSPFSVPTYSHDIYDIVPGKYEIIKNPDILIVEGINVLQLPTNQQIYVSDFFDFSIYVDADPDLIYQWFVERFLVHLEMAKGDPTNYYHEMSKMPKEHAIAYAEEVWYNINFPNLIQHIKPTMSRADVILHKTDNHVIDEIYIRKY